MVGYDNIRKVVFFGLAFGEAAYHAATKETSALKRAAAFLGCLDEAVDLFTLDFTAIKEEWANFAVEDRAALFADAAEEFDLEDDHAEAKVEGAVTAALLLLEGFEKAEAAWKAVA